MSLTVIDAEATKQLLPMAEAIDVLRSAFAAGLPESPERPSYDAGAGEFLLMPSWGSVGTGIKVITINPENSGRDLPVIHAVYVLFDPVTSAPVAVLDGAALTEIRTAAVTGVATAGLARPEASRLVLFGTGVQARAHLDAMIAVRPIRELVVVAEHKSQATALLERAREHGLRARVGVPGDVAGADIVCACTTSPVPLFDGADLAGEVHVNAIGSHHPDRRELDAATIDGASVWVEEREAASREAGDLVLAAAEGALRFDDVRDLAELSRGGVVREDLAPRTVYKGVGLAGEDLVLAAEVARRFLAGVVA